MSLYVEREKKRQIFEVNLIIPVKEVMLLSILTAGLLKGVCTGSCHAVEWMKTPLSRRPVQYIKF